MSFSKARASALAALASLALAGAAAAEPVGFIATAVNDVQVQPHGTTTFAAAIQDQEVSVGDTIRTGLDSQAKIILVDDTTLSIDEDTEITIQSLHVGAAATQDRSIIKQTRGRLRTVVGSAFGGQTRMEVHTPTAVVGVKGTDLTTEKDEEARLTGKDSDKGQWLVCLVDGQIVVRAVVGDDFSEPKPGNCVYSYGDGSFSEELANPANPFEVAFDVPSFAPTDFSTPETAPVGEGPGDGGGGDGGFEPDPVGDPPGPDDLGPTSLLNQDDIPDPPMEEPPPVDPPDDPIGGE